MTEERKSGWLSSVVGNISSLWSRQSLEEEKPPHHSFTEIQSDGDFEGEDKLDDALTKYSPDKPTTSTNGITEKSRSARYLSPTLLMNSVKSKLNSNRTSRIPATRKRPFMEVIASNGEVDEGSAMKERFSSSNIFSDDLYSEFSCRKRICRPSRFLSETAPSLDKSLLDRSIDPFNSSRDASNVSLLQSRVSRASTFTSSALSSKTLAILQQLEKISSPAMEVKKLPFKCRSERWFADERNYSAKRSLSSSSAKTPSRAQVISNTMSASLSTKSFWRRPDERPIASSKTVVDNVFEKKNGATSVFLPKSASKALENEDGLHSEEYSMNGRKKHEPVLKSSDGKSIKQIPKVFSAKTLDLEVDVAEMGDVRPLCESWSSVREISSTVDPPAPGFLGIAAKVSSSLEAEGASSSAKDEGSSSLGNDLFSFSRPEKRGPSRREVEDSDEDTSESSESGEDEESESSNDKNTELPELKKGLDAKDSATTETALTSKSENVIALKEGVEKEKLDLSASGSENVSKEPEGSHSGGEAGGKTSNASEGKSKKWTCPTCLVGNDKSAPKCVCCGTAAPAAVVVAPVTQTSENVEKTSTKETSKPWSCPDCFVPNKVEDEKCVCCGHIKKASENKKQTKETEASAVIINSATSTAATGASASNIFGDKAFKPVPVPGMSFGFKATAESAKTQSTTAESVTTNSPATLSFGVSAGAVKPGLNSSSSTPNFGSLFGLSQRSSLATVPEGKTIPPSGTPLFGISCGSSSSSDAPKTVLPEPIINQSLKTPFPTQSSDSNSSTLAPVQQPLTSLASDSVTFGKTNGTPTAITPGTSLFQASDSFGNKSFNPANNPSQTTSTLTFDSRAIFGASAPKANSEVAKTVPPSDNSQTKETVDSITMASPTSSGTSTSAQPNTGGFVFSTTAPSFNFLSNASTSGLSSNIFGSVGNNASSATPTFVFGSSSLEPAKSLGQNAANPAPAPSLTKVFSAPSTVPLPPPSFNFGGTSASSGNMFNSLTPPVFNFGANSENPFNASAPFGSTMPTTNFFNSGTTTTTTAARRVLKARRMRK